MFTIEQAGTIKKVNTIDELIIEYIKKYACQASGTLTKEDVVKLINESMGNHLQTFALKSEVDAQIEACALDTDLFDYVKKDDFNKELLKYVSSEDVENKLTELKNELGNGITNEQMTSALND